MKTQIRNFVRYITMSAVLVFASSSVLADDLTPPPWRGGPLSVFGEWQLLPGSLILNPVQWNTVGGPGGTLSTVPQSGQVLPNASTSIYDFQLPNWIDNEPIKYMRVQLTWANGPAAPVNVFSQAIKGTNTIIGSVVFASTPVLNPSGTGFYQYFDLEFKPNPDFERVQVQLPAGAYLTQTVIDTISTVPEPATIAILALGGLAIRSKRRTLTH